MTMHIKHKTPTVMICEEVKVYQYGGGLLAAETKNGSIFKTSLYELIEADEKDILYTFKNGYHTIKL